MTEFLDQAVAMLNKLYGLPAIALVFGVCLTIGYVLRFIKQFPNDGIPLAIVLFGGLGMLFIADTREVSMSLRVWTARNVFAGMIVGLCAWLMHLVLIKRLEKWLLSKVPKLNDTQFFNKDPEPPKP